jgi:predicted MFS family arabinose efflux permease
MIQLLRGIGRDTRWVLVSYVLWGIGEGSWMFIQTLYVKSLGATPDEAGIVVGMWGLGRFLCVLPAGILADRWSARKLMLPGWYLGVVGVVIIALAPDWRWSAPGFLVYGFSAAAIPVTNLYLTQAIKHDPTHRPDLPIQASLTILWAAYSLGLVITPAVGGWMGDQLGLRSVFLFSVFWFALSAVAISRTRSYPSPVRPPRGHHYAGMLRQHHVVVTFAVLTIGFVAVLIGQPFLSQYLEEEHHFSRTSIGTFGSLNALGTMVFSLLVGRLTAWRGFFACLGLVMIAFTLLLLSGSPAVVVMAVFLVGAHYTTRPLAVSVISRYVAEHQRGMAYALVDTLAGLAILNSTTLAGTLYDQTRGGPFIVGIALIVGISICAVMLRSYYAHYHILD